MKQKIIRSQLIVIVLAVIVSCNTNQTLPDIQSKIDSISLGFVPDKREGVSNVIIIPDKDTYTLKGEVGKYEHKDAIVTWLGEREITFTDSLLVLPDTTENYWGIVNVGYGNLRAQPRHSAELLTQALLGTPVKIMKKEGSWLMIQTPDSYLGWITSGSIEIKSPDQMQAWRTSERIIVTEIRSLIYSDERRKELFSDVVIGTILEKLDVSLANYQVALPDGRTGLIRRGDCSLFDEWLSTTQASAASLEEYGRNLTGVPYLWGGTTAYGLDCSGFMKTIFFANGVILARDASLQARHGDPVESSSAEYSQLLSGDLIFFGNQKTKRVTHVGMYLGNGEVIHESGTVRINSLDSTKQHFSSYLSTTFLSARRVLGLPSQQGIVSIKNHPWYVNQ
jgi:gamma-D-glutamyl-L-lysine dipeptidyl-peptidase